MRRSLLRAVAVAVVALGAGLGLTGCGGSDDGDPLARATELADIWGEGWSETDPDAVASVFTEDGQYTSFLGFTDTGRERIARHVVKLGPSVSRLVRIGDVSETTDGTFTWTVEALLNGRLHRGMAEMELQDDLVSLLWWAQDPEPVD